MLCVTFSLFSFPVSLSLSSLSLSLSSSLSLSLSQSTCVYTHMYILHLYAHTLRRVESYSCKMTKAEKKIMKQISHQDSHPGSSSLQALSSPQPYGSPLTYPPPGSPLSPVYVRMPSYASTISTASEPHMCDTICLTTLLYLRQALNLSFHPDYDFSNAKSEEFSREPDLKMVMEGVRSKLSGAAREAFAQVEGQLWSVVDEVIQFPDCEIYR